MAMDEKKRQRISIIGSISFHIIVALFVGLTGLLSFTSLENSDIFEVTAVADSGGESGGSEGSSGGESSAAPEPVANSAQQAFTPEQIGSDAILEHSDTSPTKVTYEQLEQLQQTAPENDEKQTPVVSPRPALAVKIDANGNGNGQNTKSNSEGNGNSNNSNADGNGNGNSHGDGNGNSDGNGNGGGEGGNDTGEATNEIVHNPAQPPSVISRAQPDYPSSARKAGIEGTVRIRFLVGKDGSVESASVSASSGNAELDQAALNAAYGWRFNPAKDEQGRPVRCYVNGPITFSLR